MPVVNPRAACVEALRCWEAGAGFADEVLQSVLMRSELSLLDRAFLTEAFYGIIRSLAQLDFVIGELRDGEVDAATRNVLRVGLYQILRMRVAPHAAVNETVNLAQRGRGVVNAMLRRALRELDSLRARIEAAPPPVRYSHPSFLFERWTERFGADAAIRLCEWNNRPAPLYVRANGLKVTVGELLRTARDANVLASHPKMIEVRQIPFLWVVHGLCYVQDPSTLAACELLAPQPGERVLDACAAPGGKTIHLAELMENQGRIIACDASERRLTRLRENIERLSAANIDVIRQDWAADPPRFADGTFDRILLDAPCSNTGVIRRRVDVRWRLQPEDFVRMPEKQMVLVRAVAPLLRKGGTLVYSTCSLEPEENEGLLARIQADIPFLSFVEAHQTLPFRDGVDGAYTAKFERIA